MDGIRVDDYIKNPEEALKNYAAKIKLNEREERKKEMAFEIFITFMKTNDGALMPEQRCLQLAEAFK